MTPEGQKKLQVLQREGYYVSTPEGNSMLPMIHPSRDSVVLEPLQGKIKRGDILLYETPSGTHVLHRVIRARGDTFTARGDNCYRNEPDIHRERVIGRLAFLYRGAKKLSADCPRLRLYGFARMLFYPLRRALHSLFLRLKKGAK